MPDATPQRLDQLLALALAARGCKQGSRAGGDRERRAYARSEAGLKAAGDHPEARPRPTAE